MNKFFYILLFLSTLSACSLFDDEKEPEILLSQVDGEEYMEDLQDSINSRKDTRFIEKNRYDLVNYESALNLADSLISKNNEWRPRYFNALSSYLEFNNYNIDPKDNIRFGIGVFNYFLFYPKELIEQFNSSNINQIQFWNEQLGLEIKRKSKIEGITKETIITVAQNNCKDCSDDEKILIKNMVTMLPMK
jgi:hypothetical protein